MKSKITIPHVPFYFVRHGETDWNKTNRALCNQDDISLNQTGLSQAINMSQQLTSLGITKIYSSPLMRAKQTTEIINCQLNVQFEFHTGLRKIVDEEVAIAFNQILQASDITLIVSHGEVYRILVRILNAKTDYPNAKNCGLYFFRPPDSLSAQWSISQVIDKKGTL